MCAYMYVYIYMCVYMCIYVCFIGMVRVFANCPGDVGSIPGRIIPKTLKMVLDTSTTLHIDIVAIEKGAFWSPSTTVAN